MKYPDLHRNIMHETLKPFGAECGVNLKKSFARGSI